jgi:hypothetical protein
MQGFPPERGVRSSTGETAPHPIAPASMTERGVVAGDSACLGAQGLQEVVARYRVGDFTCGWNLAAHERESSLDTPFG